MSIAESDAVASTDPRITAAPGVRAPSKRLGELDALRGIAAFAVVMFHYLTYYDRVYHHPGGAPFQFAVGKYGVQLFFMISGFVIFMTLSKTRKSMDFIVSRFSRLYPAYWAAIALTTITLFFWPLPDQSALGPWALLANMTMLEAWANVPYVDGVYWTLTVELLFYVFMFTLFRTGHLRHVLWFGCAWLMLCAVNAALVHIQGAFPGEWVRKTLFGYGNFFVAGIIFYKIKNGQSLWTHHLILAACLATGWLADGDAGWPATVFFAMFYLFAYGKLGFVAVQPFVFLGTISYPLYLLHAVIGNVVLSRCYSFHLSVPLALLTAFTVALGLASAVTYTVERPAMAWIRNWYKKRSTAVRGVVNERPAL
jgi:peptidoglycan/LPS O-acetylase OafA/YrhL